MASKPAYGDDDTTAGRDFLLYGPRLLYETYRRHWRLLFVACALFGAAAGAVGYRMWTPRYEARATLNVTEDSNPYAQQRFNVESFQREQEAQLTADDVLEDALKNPQVAKVFEGVADPMALLRRRMKVTAAGGSRVIVATYFADKPANTDVVVNGVVDVYLQKKSGEHKAKYERQLAAMDKTIREQTEDRQTAQDRLHKLAEENGVMLNERNQAAGFFAGAENLEGKLAELKAERRRLATEGTEIVERLKKLPSSAGKDERTERELTAELDAKTGQAQALEKQIAATAGNSPRLEAWQDDLGRLREATRQIRQALDYRRMKSEYDKIDRDFKIAESGIERYETQKKDFNALQRKAGVWAELKDLDRRAVNLEGSLNDLSKTKLRLKGELDGGLPVLVTKQAVEPKSPVDDGGPWRRALIFGLAGALLPFLAMVAREFFMQPITSSADLSRIAQLPLVGEIATIGFAGRNLAPTKKGLRSHVERARFEESVDYLRVSLLSAGNAAGKELRVIAVVSAKPREGKTTLAAYLARSFAGGVPGRVLLVDGDMRCPRQHEIMGGDARNGLADVLLGRIDLAEAIRPTELDRLDFLPAGRLDVPAGRALADDQFGCFVQMARQRYDYVIVDTPPILPVGDAAIIGAAVDGAILCALRDQSNADAVAKARHRLESAGVRVMGVVLNGAPPGYFGAADYYYTRGARSPAEQRPDRMLQPPASAPTAPTA